jgi:hypothetical protein
MQPESGCPAAAALFALAESLAQQDSKWAWKAEDFQVCSAGSVLNTLFLG